jgi:hypothetical protein
MAHFAELDSNNKVLRVIVVHNNELLVNGVENEQKGIDFCKSLFGSNTNWIQTSYNNNFRKQYAGINYTYDSIKDKFISPQPYPSWSLDASDNWQAPIPKPLTNLDSLNTYDDYFWEESSLNWVYVKRVLI